MTRSQILQRAKQGDERAIALVLNHVFKKRGIQTHVSRKPEGLRVVLILLEPIDRTQVLPRLRHALGKLEIPSVESVRTVACLQGNSEPLWKYEFSLKLQPSVRLESMDLRQETVRKTQTPTPDNTGFWPVFFPYPKSWIRAFRLLIPTYITASILLFIEVGRYATLAFVFQAVQPGYEVFLSLTIIFIFLSFLYFLICLFIYILLGKIILRILWKTPPKITKWLFPQRKRGVLQGFKISVLASIPASLPFHSLFLHQKILLYDSIQYLPHEERAIAAMFGLWFVSAAYLYHLDYLVARVWIPKFREKLQIWVDSAAIDRFSKRFLKVSTIAACVTVGIAASFAVSNWDILQTRFSNPAAVEATTVEPTPSQSSETTTPETPNFFREAVNYATDAATQAQTADTPEAWRQVAQGWEKAIAAMNAVPESHPKADIARQKTIEYQKNLEYARSQAERTP